MVKNPTDYGPEIMLSRELSWLDFNSRVLDEAACDKIPVLERLKFIAIFSSNLDEFFMVRVAGLRQLLKLGDPAPDDAGLTPEEQLLRIRARLDKLLKRQHRILTAELLPELERNRVRLRRIAELPETSRGELARYFQVEVLPVLTPLAVDPSHPFPVLGNGAIELAVSLRLPDKREVFAFVEVPGVLPRFIEAVDAAPGSTFVLLEDLIESQLPELFTGCEILDSLAFRITRDMDFNIAEEGVEDLLVSVEHTLLERRSREPIRLEVARNARGALARWLGEQFQLDEQFRYTVPGMLNLKHLFELVGKAARKDLLEAPWPGVDHPELSGNIDIFEAIRNAEEILLAVPFQKFDPVIRLLECAAEDPDVLAIKQTLYRVSGDSPVVAMLARAAERGKQVTVIVELKARFDEGNNIAWARHLEEAGAHVVYGISGLKIHGKALLIVRREEGLIRRYVHLSTGNYNDKTARLYTDMSIFSYDQELCGEISALFNIMTGYAMPEIQWRQIAAAPFDLRRRFLNLIDREARFSTPQNPGRIVAKMNSLVDSEIIRHLYAAADAGVRIDLIVRGICCLKPGVGNDNIRVISIVDRFLEHSRIFYFGNNGRPEYYMASADWMSRNLDRRIEILFPVKRAANRKVLDRVLELELADQCKGRRLHADGRYRLGRDGSPDSRSQYRLYRMFAAALLPENIAQLKIFTPARQ